MTSSRTPPTLASTAPPLTSSPPSSIVDGGSDAPVVVFTAEEREVIRTAFMVRFGSAPRVAEGFTLRRWSGGANKGEVKLTKAQQRMLEHGLIRVVDDGSPWPRAFFTESGLVALRVMAADPRLLNPDQYGHLIQELEGGPLSSMAQAADDSGSD